MKKTCLVLLTLTLATAALAGNKVIYGDDNRLDMYQVKNPLHRKLALSTAGMIHNSAFSAGKDKDHLNIEQAQSLQTAMNVCREEKFSQQKLAPSCSGFLIAPDILVTAGHCYEGYDNPYSICQDYKWVFSYQQNSASHDPTKDIKLNDVYGCKEVLSVRLDDNLDYAIIRLDRKTDRPALPFRQSGKISEADPLVVIGHPVGLPTKVAAGAMVTKNSEKVRFSASLDTFQGNSGSAVFNAKTGVVEGILVMGKTDFVPKDPSDVNSCYISNKCDQFSRNCAAGREDRVIEKGEVVIRTTAILFQMLKAIR